MATWKADLEHSQIRFSVKNMAVAMIRGQFTDFTVEVQTTDDSFSDPLIEVDIPCGSLTTDNLERDAHLQGPDFFDVGKFPTLKFFGKTFVPQDENQFELTGTLTIKDKSKEITLLAEFGGIAHGFDGEKRAGFSLEGKINRFEFGLVWNDLLDAAVPIVGADVKISIDVELIAETE